MKIKGKINQIIAELSAALTSFDLTKDYVCEIKLYRMARSLDANAYFHVLCDKLRQKLGISMAQCKNELITSYGQIEYFGEGEAVVYKTNAPPEYIRELETVHMKLVKASEEDEREVFFYRVYRGSHTYDTAEMSRLIEGTINECREQGIDTATPDELKQMMNLWERRYERKKSAVSASE